MTTQEAADYCKLTYSYLKNLRTEQAKSRNLDSPKYIIIENFGTIAGRRVVRYKQSDLNIWLEKHRKAPFLVEMATK